MNSQELNITESDISKSLNRAIKSPMRIGNLKSIGIEHQAFLDFFSPIFEELSWDPYDVRRLQVNFLMAHFPSDESKIKSLLKAYFIGDIQTSAFQKWIDQLNADQKLAFEKIQPWRRRSVSQFILDEKQNIVREPVDQFVQGVESDDYRSWPRVFEESPKKHVDNHFFRDLLLRFYDTVKTVHPSLHKLKVIAHFMSVKATLESPGDNSPEGAHEDGANFIVSALVVNRINLQGGESQILEKLDTGIKEIVFRRTLAPGEFIFQADTGEELIYGNDLWHHVTPFYIADASKGEGWRDIIGFDLIIVE